jgi:hypothetical protein
MRDLRLYGADERLPTVKVMDAVRGTRQKGNAMRVDDSYAFLHDELIPHARAEEAALYPVVQRVIGAPETTATMARDHVEVEEEVYLPILEARLSDAEAKQMFADMHAASHHGHS